MPWASVKPRRASLIKNKGAINSDAATATGTQAFAKSAKRPGATLPAGMPPAWQHLSRSGRAFRCCCCGCCSVVYGVVALSFEALVMRCFRTPPPRALWHAIYAIIRHLVPSSTLHTIVWCAFYKTEKRFKFKWNLRIIYFKFDLIWNSCKNYYNRDGIQEKASWKLKDIKLSMSSPVEFEDARVDRDWLIVSEHQPVFWNLISSRVRPIAI